MATYQTLSYMVEGAGVGRISPCTLTTGSEKEIASYGSALDFIIVSGQKVSIAGPASKEYAAIETTRNVTIEHTLTKRKANEAGNPKSSGGDDDKLTLTVAVPPEHMTSLISIVRNGTPCGIVIGEALDESGALTGYYYFHGRIEGNLEMDFTNEIQTVELTFSGGEAFTYDDSTDVDEFNTALTGASSTITPAGLDTEVYAITIPDLATSDETNLLSGNLLRKAV